MTLGQLLGEAGWLMSPIYACSLVVVALVVHKLLELRAARTRDLEWLDPTLRAVAEGDIGGATRTCAGRANPSARAVQALLEALPRRPDRAEADAARVGSAELQRLDSRLGLLSFIAQAAPLLGLLGTVIGMVELFMAIQSAGATEIDPNLLSSGIWKALLTTAAGLVVAVPALGAYAWLTGRVDRVKLQISDSVARVLSELPNPAENQTTARSPSMGEGQGSDHETHTEGSSGAP